MAWATENADYLLHCHFTKFSLVFKSNGNPQNIIRALLVEKDSSFAPAIKWGIEHKETVKQQYTVQMQQSHEGV